MNKRRRERDRPKAGPDAIYDPNKRVQLSYSDDDNDDEEPRKDPPALEQHPPINYARAKTTTHSPSRTNSAADLDDQSEAASIGDAQENHRNTAAPYNLANNAHRRVKPNAKPYKGDSTYMAPALGSTSLQWDEDWDEEQEHLSEEDEAMAYLRDVRSQRLALPALFRAECAYRETVDYAAGDSRGYNDDDSYIARPVLRPQPPNQSTVPAEEAYTTMLKRRFEIMRAHLKSLPTVDAKEIQNSKVPLLRLGKSKNLQYKCMRTVRSTAPLPVQLKALSRQDTLNALQLIQQFYFVRGKTLGRNTSAWVLALLTNLDDIGAMEMDEVCLIRDLGKRAIVIQLSFTAPAMSKELEDFWRAQAGSENGEEPEPSKSAKPAAATTDADDTDTSDSNVSQTQMADTDNTLATLDMILTVVGNFFGQSDLLESRTSWEPEE